MSQFPMFCDGNGQCARPIVKCGGDGDCGQDGRQCCGTTTGLSCQTAACPTAPSLGPYYCDERSDCLPTQVCCVESTLGGTDSICIAATLCASDAGGQRRQACNPAATTSECDTGSCQAPTDSFVPPGWHVCR